VCYEAGSCDCKMLGEQLTAAGGRRGYEKVGECVSDIVALWRPCLYD
jgi:hypothetical protein